MDVTLYKNLSTENTLNKTLTQVAKYTSVQLPEPTDDADVTIRMAVPTDTLKWSSINYFEWDGAYYYVDSVEKVANSDTELHGRMDLLMTYSAAIKALKVLPERSTSNGSRRLEDQNRRISADSTRTVLNYPNPIAGSEAMGAYVITTAQNGYSV